jgi:hypothetical protein
MPTNPVIQASTPTPGDGPLSAEVYNRSLGLPPNINPVTRQWIDIATAVAKLGDELIANLCRLQPETPFDADVAEALQILDSKADRVEGVRWVVTVHRNRQLHLLRALAVANRELSELRATVVTQAAEIGRLNGELSGVKVHALNLDDAAGAIRANLIGCESHADKDTARLLSWIAKRLKDAQLSTKAPGMAEGAETLEPLKNWKVDRW